MISSLLWNSAASPVQANGDCKCGMIVINRDQFSKSQNAIYTNNPPPKKNQPISPSFLNPKFKKIRIVQGRCAQYSEIRVSNVAMPPPTAIPSPITSESAPIISLITNYCTSSILRFCSQSVVCSPLLRSAIQYSQFISLQLPSMWLPPPQHPNLKIRDANNIPKSDFQRSRCAYCYPNSNYFRVCAHAPIISADNPLLHFFDSAADPVHPDLCSALLRSALLCSALLCTAIPALLCSALLRSALLLCPAPLRCAPLCHPIFTVQFSPLQLSCIYLPLFQSSIHQNRNAPAQSQSQLP